MSTKPFHWTRWVLFAALLLIGFTLFQPSVDRARENPRRSQCQSNLKQIILALRQYDADYDARFPSLDTPAGWREALSPYVPNAAVFQCPGDSDASPRTADYFFNARLSGARENSLASWDSTLIFGEGYPTSDPRVAFSQLPKSWLADPKFPARRHLDGLNVAFLDGHAKWLRPEKIGTQAPRRDTVTFAVR